MVLSGRSRLGEVPRRTTRVRGAAPHPDDDHDRDADPDEDVADAEHVVEGQPRGRAKMSVSGARTALSTIALFE